MRLHRETNSLDARPRGGGNVSPIHDRIAELLAAVVAEAPDATVVELAETLGHQHEPIRRHTSAYATRLLSKKKSFVATERDTPANLERREEFRALLNETALDRFVFIDESFVQTGCVASTGDRSVGNA